MRSLIVVDTPGRWPLRIPNTEVVAARDYIADQAFADGPGSKIFNLCRSYRYQSAGYYVSLLAEARQHRPLPSITTIQDLRLASVVRLTGQDLSQLVATSLRRLRSERFELSIYFGRNLSASYDKLSLALFNAFPAPFLRATFEAKPDWILTSLRLIGSAEIPEAHLDFVVEQAQRYLKRAPRKPRARKEARFDLAILHDPEEQLPPSDQGGLRHFLEAGDSLGIRCELIRKEAYGRLAEFAAFFFRGPPPSTTTPTASPAAPGRRVCSSSTIPSPSCVARTKSILPRPCTASASPRPARLPSAATPRSASAWRSAFLACSSSLTAPSPRG